MAHRGSGAPLLVKLVMAHHIHSAPLVSYFQKKFQSLFIYFFKTSNGAPVDSAPLLVKTSNGAPRHGAPLVTNIFLFFIFTFFQNY